MGDYDIRISYYLNDTLVSVFSGNASFNGDAFFSGQVKEDNTGLVGKLAGIVKLDPYQIVLNFLKSDDERPMMEFQVFKKRENKGYQGSYKGSWRHKPGNFEYDDHLWSTRNILREMWISESIIKEKQALIELNPPPEI